MPTACSHKSPNRASGSFTSHHPNESKQRRCVVETSSPCGRSGPRRFPALARPPGAARTGPDRFAAHERDVVSRMLTIPPPCAMLSPNRQPPRQDEMRLSRAILIAAAAWTEKGRAGPEPTPIVSSLRRDFLPPSALRRGSLLRPPTPVPRPCLTPIALSFRRSPPTLIRTLPPRR